MSSATGGSPLQVLSHRTAAALWNLLPPPPSLPAITTPIKRRSHPRIRYHSAAIPPDERTTRHQIPTTTVPRTLLDLATTLDRHRLERTIAEADHLRLTDPLSLVAIIDRHRGRRGTATLRSILKDGAASKGITRSELEDRFLRFLDANRLPRPELNAPIHLGDRFVGVECLWRERRLVAELDGRAAHRTAASFERDRARDRALAAAGWRTIRITWRQLHRAADPLRRDLRALLDTVST